TNSMKQDPQLCCTFSLQPLMCFKEPVVLSCSHSFCKGCLKSWSDPPLNLVCRVHSERLKLFCLTDQQPVCVVCRDSKVHEDHRFRPIVEAAQDLRDELDKSLLPLKKNLQKAKDFKKEFVEIADCIKNQVYQTKGQIEAEFKKLHQFLVEEEESRMKLLSRIHFILKSFLHVVSFLLLSV
uniref:B box-type domain-containing protein n=1 Tax=Neogobius melanostomus TaxID=47308 RepID=A0A8C6SEH1_9GOBI